MRTSTLNECEQWRPLDLSTLIVSLPATRSAARLDRVLDQFSVETSARYMRAANGATFCNIFAWDFCCAMGVELPHWIDPVTRLACDVGKGEEMSANCMPGWLENVGRNLGWLECGPAGAQQEADDGHPTLAVWQAHVGHTGHVAVVTPHGWNRQDGPWICNVGARNFRRGPLARGFGSMVPRYWSAL